MDECEKNVLIAMISCFFAFGIISLFILGGDTGDIVNVRYLGEKLCEEKGYVYDHREMSNEVLFVPIIYCKPNITQEKLIDGIVLLK